MKMLGSNIQTQRNQGGFTIIELVVVILLLGILTATALPRFLDVTDEAHAAVVDGVRSGLQTGAILYRSAWIAGGQVGTDTAVSQFGDGTLAPSSAGYPLEVSPADGSIDGGTDCDNIFTGLLQVGRPTTNVVTPGGLDATPTAGQLAYTSDVNVFAIDADTCQFVYTAQGSGVSSPIINYEAATGAVTESGAL